jgi:hypothetical protein
MKRTILIGILVLLAVQPLASATDRYVPSRTYPTIQSAISASINGDTVIVAPGTYSGSGNRNLDFGGRAITVRSDINPANPNWDTIANTIIDCGGKPAHSTSQDSGKKLIGFTIINGYARGPKGADGEEGYFGDPFEDFIPEPLDDPFQAPPIGLPGADRTGNGYGGGILCEGSSSPTIQYCVFRNCTVTGAEGGRGAPGLSGVWLHFILDDASDEDPTVLDPNAEPTDNSNGQHGGDGGFGRGNGHGAAIACKSSSSPVIIGCIFENNIARGGVGGDGGPGGSAFFDGAEYDGTGGWGGIGAMGEGDGKGAAIYSYYGSNPVVTDCTFTGNAATIGIGGNPGAVGAGDATDPPFPPYFVGWATPNFAISTGGIAGGAAYYDTTSNPNFVNCTFTDNKAYEVPLWYQLDQFGPEASYTIGGALYACQGTTANIDTCSFIDNLGGALYFESGCTVDIHNSYDPNRHCLFSGNSDPNDDGDHFVDMDSDIGVDDGSGGAIFFGAGCNVDMRNCNISGNVAKNDGGGIECRGDISMTDCSLSNNTAGFYGGGLDLYSGSPLVLDANGCSFIANQAIYGGGFSTEMGDSNFVNCYFVDNTAENGGGIDVAYGNIAFTGGRLTDNNATLDGGGGLNCLYTSMEIRDCLIDKNASAGAMGTGGGINIYGQSSPQLIKNCLINNNYASLFGGGICAENTQAVEIQNCTFYQDFTDGFGGAIFSNWLSFVDISDSIFSGCTSHAIHEEDDTGDASVQYSLFYGNSDGDYYDSGTASTYSCGGIPGGSNNICGAPLFVDGVEDEGEDDDEYDDFYLNQFSSPAVNTGSATALSLGLDTYTTDPALAPVPDSGQVDVGYHYRISDANVPKFKLYTSVVSFGPS